MCDSCELKLGGLLQKPCGCACGKSSLYQMSHFVNWQPEGTAPHYRIIACRRCSHVVARRTKGDQGRKGLRIS